MLCDGGFPEDLPRLNTKTFVKSIYIFLSLVNCERTEMQKLTSASPISEKTRPIDKYDASETDFYRMLKWSPDGSCLLALTESSRFDLFEFPFHALQHTDDSKMKQRWQPISSMLISNNVHDFAWYPGMLSQGMFHS